MTFKHRHILFWLSFCVYALILTVPILILQTCIAKHESNGIDIIIALIVNSINPLGKHRLDLVLELKVRVAISSHCYTVALLMICLLGLKRLGTR